MKFLSIFGTVAISLSSVSPLIYLNSHKINEEIINLDDIKINKGNILLDADTKFDKRVLVLRILANESVNQSDSSNILKKVIKDIGNNENDWTLDLNISKIPHPGESQLVHFELSSKDKAKFTGNLIFDYTISTKISNKTFDEIFPDHKAIEGLFKPNDFYSDDLENKVRDFIVNNYSDILEEYMITKEDIYVNWENSDYRNICLECTKLEGKHYFPIKFDTENILKNCELKFRDTDSSTNSLSFYQYFLIPNVQSKLLVNYNISYDLSGDFYDDLNVEHITEKSVKLEISTFTHIFEWKNSNKERSIRIDQQKETYLSSSISLVIEIYFAKYVYKAGHFGFKNLVFNNFKIVYPWSN